MNFSIIRRCVRKENEFVLNVDLNKLKNGYLTLRRKCNLVRPSLEKRLDRIDKGLREINEYLDRLMPPKETDEQKLKRLFGE